MSKNIVVFSDGTGQEGGEDNNTNIYKMFNMVEDRSVRQIAFYDAGLGSGLRKFTGNVGGAGISKNIQECYQFIFENYEVGDQIYLFGFSRGAATVRSLSSLIHYFGILPKSRPELIKEAYKIYKKAKNIEELQINSQKFLQKHHNIWTHIKFIGCFDTVAALGSPWTSLNSIINHVPFFKHKFHNFKLSESIENAYHALAIDDKRKIFHPILWERTGHKFKIEGQEIEQNLKQVWFAGMHTDVGGGYEEQNISDIPLVWMTQQAYKHGLLLYPKHKVIIDEDENGIMHNSRSTRLTQIYTPKERFYKNDAEKPLVHESVLRRNKNEQNEDTPKYHPWIVHNEDKYDMEPWVHFEEQAWYQSK